MQEAIAFPSGLKVETVAAAYTYKIQYRPFINTELFKRLPLGYHFVIYTQRAQGKCQLQVKTEDRFIF